MLKINLLSQMVIPILVVLIVLTSIGKASKENPTLDSSSNTVFVNSRSNELQDVMINFGLLIATLFLLVLAKSIFDYIRIRNQSLLISY